MNEHDFVDGISIGGYRSFGSVQRIGPFGRINIFIGSNNSGKSNILKFIHEHLDHLRNSDRNGPSNWKLNRLIDLHSAEDVKPICGGIGKRFDSKEFREIEQRIFDDTNRELFKAILQQLELCDQTEMVWRERVAVNFDSQFELRAVTREQAQQMIGRLDTNGNRIANVLKGIDENASGGDYHSQLAYICNFLLRPPMSLPKVDFIPAVRQVTAQAQESQSWGGIGIVDRLARLQILGTPNWSKNNSLKELKYYYKK